MDRVQDVGEKVVVEARRSPLVTNTLHDAEDQVQVVENGCNEVIVSDRENEKCNLMTKKKKPIYECIQLQMKRYQFNEMNGRRDIKRGNKRR